VTTLDLHEVIAAAERLPVCRSIIGLGAPGTCGTPTSISRVADARPVTDDLVDRARERLCATLGPWQACRRR
jgi:hypothetical protein